MPVSDPTPSHFRRQYVVSQPRCELTADFRDPCSTTTYCSARCRIAHCSSCLPLSAAVAGIGGWELDRLSGQLLWSDETCRIHGVPPGHQPTLEEAIHLYAPESRPRIQSAVQRIDLDQFKLVNDSCGHSVGDQMLQQAAKLFGEPVRVRDTLARLGGDEFGIILEHCSMEHAQRVAQQICDRLHEFRFVHDSRNFRMGASIGLVPIGGRWSSAAAVMQAGDTTCYAAKESGRNRVHVWIDTDTGIRRRHGEMQWAVRIENALDENQFVLYGQRIEQLTQSPSHLQAEVLLRMLDADGSLILPGAFCRRPSVFISPRA